MLIFLFIYFNFYRLHMLSHNQKIYIIKNKPFHKPICPLSQHVNPSQIYLPLNPHAAWLPWTGACKLKCTMVLVSTVTWCFIFFPFCFLQQQFAHIWHVSVFFWDTLSWSKKSYSPFLLWDTRFVGLLIDFLWFKHLCCRFEPSASANKCTVNMKKFAHTSLLAISLLWIDWIQQHSHSYIAVPWILWA